VIVGGRSTLGDLRLGKDEFRNPYHLIGARFSKGPEVHLTMLLNLLRGEWLTRLSARLELPFAILVGLVLGGGLLWLRPHLAALAALLSVLTIAGLDVWLFTRHHIWFAWCIPAFVQAPLALVWAVGTRYFIEERRRNALRNAFAHYLSPQMADRIADADFDLSLGGTVVEATVMFTDLENFAPLTEALEKPELISDVLTTYFTLTTGHILENDGTIIKYVGDSVHAVWGAPLPDEDHARKAVLAAWRLHEASIMEVQGHPLRTRVGVNTGLMLSGNLGSAQRFDYAVTGDAVNFGSRLEGMNKQLGTSVLISDSVKARIGDAFAARCVGEFRVVGKKVPRVIYELLGDKPSSVEEQKWIGEFERGLAAFRVGDFDSAEAAMRATITTRGTDGPSSFYLARVAELRAKGLPADWAGIVELTAK
jgi:adenylate cyclase